MTEVPFEINKICGLKWKSNEWGKNCIIVVIKMKALVFIRQAATCGCCHFPWVGSERYKDGTDYQQDTWGTLLLHEKLHGFKSVCRFWPLCPCFKWHRGWHFTATQHHRNTILFLCYTLPVTWHITVSFPNIFLNWRNNFCSFIWYEQYWFLIERLWMTQPVSEDIVSVSTFKKFKFPKKTKTKKSKIKFV